MTTKKLCNNWSCITTGNSYIPSAKAHGIVYLITDIASGKKYVGKKQVVKTKPLGKKEMALIEKIDKRKKYVKKVSTDWKTYTTSNKTLSAKIKDSGDIRNIQFTFNVLHECYDETALKFKELEEMILHGTFASVDGMNDNIQIKQIGKIQNLNDRFRSL